MKKLIALLLALLLALVGCTTPNTNDETSNEITTDKPAEVTDAPIPDFSGLGDPALVTYLETDIYKDTVLALNSTDYIIESIDASYISKEYLEEISYNSQSNIFFGHTLAELDAAFCDTRYIFTLGADGQTVVTALETIPNDTYTNILKDVAVGTGVIIVGVTATYVSAVTGNIPMMMIFACSTAGAVNDAIIGSAIGGIIAGALRGYQTGDMSEALKAGATGAAEGFKWGAIEGGLLGGATELFALYQGIKSGLTMTEVALIQLKSAQLGVTLPAKLIGTMSSIDDFTRLAASNLPLDDIVKLYNKTGWSCDILARLRNMDEAEIYRSLDLKDIFIDGKHYLIRDIDLNFVSDTAGTPMTNLERMKAGYAAIDPKTGLSYELHHVGQQVDSPLAVLTPAEHRQGNNNRILHDLNLEDGNGVHSQLTTSQWNKQRQDFWKNFAKSLTDQ